MGRQEGMLFPERFDNLKGDVIRSPVFQGKVEQ
jgi:hypothetical protein